MKGNNRNKGERSNKGISLVALVITIVVIFILSAISIGTLLGDNGIIQKAKEAGDKYKNSSINEQTQLNEVADLLEQMGVPTGDIEIKSEPTNPRNTIQKGEQNGILTGSIQVSLDFKKERGLIKEYAIQKIGKTGNIVWQVATKNPITFEVTENTTILARYKNIEQNTSQTITYNVVCVDNTAPNAFNYIVTEKTTNSITIKAEAIDTAEIGAGNDIAGIGRYQYSKDNGLTWQERDTNPTNTSYTFTNLIQGQNYSIAVKAIDKAGNEKEATNNGTIVTTNEIAGGNEDNTGLITIIPNTANWTNQDIAVTVNWPENIEGLTKEINTNKGSTWKTYTGQETITGNTTIMARLKDSTGQTSTKTAVLNITNIDKLKPNTFNFATSATTNSITVTGSTSDQEASITDGNSGVKGYQYSINNGTWNEITSNTSNLFNNLLQGQNYIIKMKAIDNAGNETEASNSSTTITVGNIPGGDGGNTGLITIIPSTANWTNQNISVTVNWPTSSENFIKELSTNNGSAWKTYTEAETIAENTIIMARLKDSTGQTSTKTAVLNVTNIDKLKPNVFNFSTSTTTNSITVNGSTSDQTATQTDGSSGIKGYQYSINNGVWNSITTNTSNLFSDLTQGQGYTIKMKAIDNAGNETEASNGSTTITVGNIPGGDGGNTGLITIMPSTANWTNQNMTVTVNWPSNITGLIKEISTNNGGTWKTYTGEEIITGNTTIMARLKDSTGQTSTKTAVLNITNIDKVAPQASISNTVTSMYNFAIQVNGQDMESGISSITWYYRKSSDAYTSQKDTYTIQNGNTLGSTEITKNKSYSGLSSNSEHLAYAVVTDVAGNSVQTSTLTVSTKKVIASVDNVEYASITEAITAITANTEKTVLILQDTKENFTIPSNKNVILDLNNKVIKSTVTNQGNLTLKNGTISSENARTIMNSGTFTMLSGTIAVPLGGNYTSLYNMQNGKVTIAGGTINNTSANGIYNAEGGNVRITAGTIATTTETALSNYGTVSIENSANIATISGRGLYNAKTGNTTMTGGTLTSENSNAIYNVEGGSVRITGGTVKSSTETSISTFGMMYVESSAKIYSDSGIAIYVQTTGNVSITGGSVSTNNSSTIYSVGGGTISITGGTVSSNNANTIYSASGGTLAITGGTISSVSKNAIFNYGSVRITGGTVKSSTETAISAFGTVSIENTANIFSNSGMGIYVQKTGNVTILGGTVTINNTNAINNYGILNIKGGTITSTGQSYPTVYNHSTIVMIEGTIRNNGNGVAIHNEGGKVTITGGTTYPRNSGI